MSDCHNIEAYGARPGGETMNTKAIQAAIDACAEAGGGVVYCGPGTYLTGSIELKSGVELRLSPGCEIVGSPNPDDYQPLISEGFKHEMAPEGTADYLIGAQHARKVAVTGPGIINASGPSFYGELRPDGRKFAGKPKRRPRLLMMHKCVDVRIEETASAKLEEIAKVKRKRERKRVCARHGATRNSRFTLCDEFLLGFKDLTQLSL